MERRFKIFSDPVHGFISVPRDLILDLIQTPEVQRLRRIRQLGVGYLVFPGAEHTRFGHALGAMALMQDTLGTLAEKGTPISEDESRAAQAVALLHDIGHGPFSHTLENVLIEEFHHEQMSRIMLTRLNQRFDGVLDLALAMFDNSYARPFFHELISSQLDMDRLDYLRRDSFYSGVVEGKVGIQRIIETMRVFPTPGAADAHVLIETKGIYAVENYLIARRLMYWQVYLHKTVLAGDHLLRAVIQRVRMHLVQGHWRIAEGCSQPFLFFLKNRVVGSALEKDEIVEAYCELDDADVLYSIKRWLHSEDRILADLCRRFLSRDFFRVTFLDTEPSAEQLLVWKQRIARYLTDRALSSRSEALDDAEYFFTLDVSRHSGYERIANSIKVIDRNDQITELSLMADTVAVAALTRFEEKPYVCYPKEVNLFEEA